MVAEGRKKIRERTKARSGGESLRWAEARHEPRERLDEADAVWVDFLDPTVVLKSVAKNADVVPDARLVAEGLGVDEESGARIEGSDYLS